MTFNNWRELLQAAPQHKRLALVLILIDFDGYSFSYAVEYVERLTDDAVRSEILEHQTWEKMRERLNTDKNSTV